MILSTNYGLRGFEAGNLADIERINLMFYHPEVMKAKGYFRQGYTLDAKNHLLCSDKSMFECESGITKSGKDISLAVTDHEMGVLGWIWFYKDKYHPLPKMVQKNLGINDQNSTIYQISYEKLLSYGWTAKLLKAAKYVTSDYLRTERKGVIVAGLSLAIAKLADEFLNMHGSQKKLVFYAYVLASNIASRKVLEKNEFVQIERKYKYDGENASLWVKII